MSSHLSPAVLPPEPAAVFGDDPATVLDAAAWAQAAMIGTLRDALTAPLSDVLAANPRRTAVLEAVGFVQRDGDGYAVHPSLGLGRPFADAKLSSLRQAASAAVPDRNGTASGGWAGQDDAVLLGTGRASAIAGRFLATQVIPQLTGLAGRLNVPGSRVLDVGTGVGAIAVALARELPAVHVVGIDIMDRALNLARGELASATDVADRVSLRQLDVADLAEQAVYDLIWLPAPFLSEAALRAGLPRVADALCPGGWLVVGTNPAPEGELLLAVGRWQAALHDGNAFDSDWMAASMTAAGLREVRSFHTFKGGPVLLAARRLLPRQQRHVHEVRVTVPGQRPDGAVGVGQAVGVRG